MKKLIISVAIILYVGLVPGFGQQVVSVNANQSTNTSEEIVYVTKTGAKYHKDSCRYLSKSKIPISLSKAKELYSPCSVCLGKISTETPAKNEAVSDKTSSDTNDKLTNDRTSTGLPIYTGPRGGRYHYSKSGKKVYEKK